MTAAKATPDRDARQRGHGAATLNHPCSPARTAPPDHVRGRVLPPSLCSRSRLRHAILTDVHHLTSASSIFPSWDIGGTKDGARRFSSCAKQEDVMKKLALALTAAMALVAVPLATSHAATSAQPVLAQSGDMTDVSSHGRYWRHRYYRHHVFFYHRPYY